MTNSITNQLDPSRATFTQRRPVLSVVIIELLLLVAVFAAGAYATIEELDYTAPILISFIPIALVCIVSFTARKKWKAYGFNSLSALTPSSLYCYAPLVLVLIILSLKGFKTVTFSELLFFVFFTVLVGFVEETVYRGMILHILLPKGIAPAVIASSILFSLTHVLNMLSGQDMARTILQLVYALLVGAVLALLMVKTKQILPLILFHTLHNLIQFLGNETTSTIGYDTIVIVILSAACLLLIPGIRNETRRTDRAEHTSY
ncbi:CPBP family intramembrane glutamic endopeptidase [Paenibacillus apiarius]|uniref:CPBP family intramembrane glutamic endopeptidase n=1 Tax=Paenibacillus apiarius TaxID=46240 RepID=UPI00197E188F|nr:type II CAAX endopeptidase family protein [Paenibacillus apiarius]MBN3524985.1 CPBP family intramembrane metalloprotease [Paenibacillus apiarius]